MFKITVLVFTVYTFTLCILQSYMLSQYLQKSYHFVLGPVSSVLFVVIDEPSLFRNRCGFKLFSCILICLLSMCLSLLGFIYTSCNYVFVSKDYLVNCFEEDLPHKVYLKQTSFNISCFTLFTMILPFILIL